MAIDEKAVEEAIKLIIKAIGENLEREGLRETPKRVARMFKEIFSGYEAEVEPVTFSENVDLVVLAGIPFTSLCEHHLLPFTGLAHVAYIPRGKVLGASKIVRIVRKYSARLQIQERITRQVMSEVAEAAGTDSVMVVTEAVHTCMVTRGVRVLSPLVSIAWSGEFERRSELVDRVLKIIEPYRLRIPVLPSS